MAEHQCLTKEDFDLIGAGSPQEVREKAAKLAARLDAQAVSKTDSNHINPLLRPTRPGARIRLRRRRTTGCARRWPDSGINTSKET